MKQIFRKKNSLNDKLILVFGGWGSDKNLFGYTPPEGYDMMVCFDYTDMDFDAQEILQYRQVSLMAWSLGVWVAEKVLSRHKIKWDCKIAVNGTTFPIDDRKGIPQNIFDGTISGFCEAALYKFRRRMCGTQSELEKFLSHESYRNEASLIEELTAIRSYITESYIGEKDIEDGIKDATENVIENGVENPVENGSEKEKYPDSFWDKAVIGRKDRIFPPENQERAWSERKTEIKYADIAHYDDEFFRTCIDSHCHI